MSCDWNIYCVDCEESYGFNDADHQDDLMAHLIANAPLIVSLVPLLVSPHDVELRTFYGDIDPRWFAKHAGHRLRPRDEYGRMSGQCHVRVDCECGTPRYCAKDEFHEGEHSAKGKLQ